MEFLIENWYLLFGGFALFFAALIAARRFWNLPTAQQLASVKEWLLWAVSQAEADLGSGTGKLKLRLVYDMFLNTFPWIAKVISFEAFSIMVDKALEEMREMLVSNPAIAAIVVGEEVK